MTRQERNEMVQRTLDEVRTIQTELAEIKAAIDKLTRKKAGDEEISFVEVGRHH